MELRQVELCSSLSSIDSLIGWLLKLYILSTYKVQTRLVMTEDLSIRVKRNGVLRCKDFFNVHE